MSALDRRTILRYGHFYAGGGGGIEQYLSDLNRALLERNALRIIQLQLTSDPNCVGEDEEISGQGCLLQKSLFVDQASHERAIAGPRQKAAWLSRCKKRVRQGLPSVPGVYPLWKRTMGAWRGVHRRDGEPQGAGEAVLALHHRFPLDLICLHSTGGADASEVLDAAQARGIPVVCIHHFSNDRLAGLSVRSQLERVAGVAGVCGVDVPAFLGTRLRCVADGIDTDFFSRERACPPPQRGAEPLIFLPARITPAKGQATLLRATGELKRRGLKFRVALAGRVDDPSFLRELWQLVQQQGLTDQVEFVGQLGPAELRDWYAAAAVLAFPTHHHEGLPRTLLEAQAMSLPAVVNEIGGTAEGIVDGETGFLTHPQDFTGFVTRLEQLLSDEGLRSRMGAAARRRVEAKFDLQNLAQRHERFYSEILGAPSLVESKAPPLPAISHRAHD